MPEKKIIPPPPPSTLRQWEHYALLLPIAVAVVVLPYLGHFDKCQISSEH